MGDSTDTQLCSTSSSPITLAPGNANQILIFNGYGGPLYECSFTVPIYPAYTDTSTPAYPRYVYQEYSTIDKFSLSPMFAAIVLWSTALALSALTLVNVLVLTTPKKRGTPLQWFVLLGICGEIGLASTAVWLYISGGQGSSYLLITRDYSRNSWTLSWSVATALHQIFGCLALLSAETALFIQGRVMLEWVKFKWRIHVYVTVLTLVALTGFAAVVLRIVLAGFVIGYLEILNDGVELSTMSQIVGLPYVTLLMVENLATLTSLCCWCAIFATSATKQLKRRYQLNVSNSENQFEGLSVELISAVFYGLVVPGLYAVHYSDPSNTKILAIPLILAFLPTNSLFTHAESARPVPHPLENKYEGGKELGAMLPESVSDGEVVCASANDWERLPTSRMLRSEVVSAEVRPLQHEGVELDSVAVAQQHSVT